MNTHSYRLLIWLIGFISLTPWPLPARSEKGVPLAPLQQFLRELESEAKQRGLESPSQFPVLLRSLEQTLEEQALKADPWQRYIIFKNDLDITIYPIIQAPVDVNPGPGGECRNGLGPDSTIRTRRIIVNYNQKGAGIPPKEEVKVYLPKDKPCWYVASRILIFTANLEDFNDRLPVLLQQDQATIPDTLGLHGLCAEDACWTGTAKADYGSDAPMQLLEYTVEDIDPKTGSNFNDRDNQNGIPAIDFDVSYVDDAYLPVAMSLDDGGATYYMGTTIPYTTFIQKAEEFMASSAYWANYAAYTDEIWQYNLFHDLVMQTDRLPSANILTVGTWTGGVSGYFDVPPNVGPRACSLNPLCEQANLSGNCCPNDGGVQLGCCNVQRYIIEGTEKEFDTNDTSFIFTSGSLKALADRWTRWLKPKGDQDDPCSNINNIKNWPPHNPSVFDQQKMQAFCDSFRDTVQFIWNEFSHTNCTNEIDPKKKDQCLIAAIIGYDSQESGRKNESVQALQRGVPWNADAPKYQDDKFVLYWPPIDSIFNLNPYAGFIHNTIKAPGAYSFSIDDRYGNFGGKGSGLRIDVGGSSIVQDKEPYDPYEQFQVALAPGWHHARVCASERSIPPLAQKPLVDGGVGIAFAFNFWRDGDPIDTCIIELFADSEGKSYVEYKVEKQIKTVTDTYTGVSHEVVAIDFDKNACKANSTLSRLCDLTVLSAPENNGNVAYESVKKADRPNVIINVPTPL